MLSLLGWRGPWYEKLGISFLLSSGLQSLLYFVVLTYGVKATLSSYSYFLLFFVLISWLASRWINTVTQPVTLSKSSPSKKTRAFAAACWAIIILLFLVTAIYATYRPVYSTDSIGLYDFRAKVIVATGIMSNIRSIDNWYAYPMFTTMVATILRLFGYENPSLFYPLMYFAFAVVFYANLRLRLSSAVASLFTLLMYATPITLWQSKLDGMTNLPYLVFYVIAISFLGRYWHSKHNSAPLVLLSFTFLGFASWTRLTEPLWVVPVVLLIVSTFWKREWFFPVLSLGIFWSIRSVWPNFTHASHMSVVGATQSLLSNSTPSPRVRQLGLPVIILLAVKFVWSALVNSLSHLIYLFGLVGLVDLLRKLEQGQLYYLLTILGNLAILLVSVIFVAKSYPDWYTLDNSFGRMISYLSPLIWLYLSNSPLWYRIKSWPK